MQIFLQKLHQLVNATEYLNNEQRKALLALTEDGAKTFYKNMHTMVENIMIQQKITRNEAVTQLKIISPTLGFIWDALERQREF